jgi:hypothetical protein
MRPFVDSRHLRTDIVAKVSGWQLGRNNRISTRKSLNQHCSSAADLEPMLRTRMPKIICNNIGPMPSSEIRTRHCAIPDRGTDIVNVRFSCVKQALLNPWILSYDRDSNAWR